MKIAQYIDHTLLKATATEAEVVQLCKEAKKYKYFGFTEIEKGKSMRFA